MTQTIEMRWPTRSILSHGATWQDKRLYIAHCQLVARRGILIAPSASGPIVLAISFVPPATKSLDEWCRQYRLRHTKMAADCIAEAVANHLGLDDAGSFAEVITTTMPACGAGMVSVAIESALGLL
jgi:hypothetical protein